MLDEEDDPAGCDVGKETPGEECIHGGRVRFQVQACGYMQTWPSSGMDTRAFFRMSGYGVAPGRVVQQE